MKGLWNEYLGEIPDQIMRHRSVGNNTCRSVGQCLDRTFSHGSGRSDMVWIGQILSSNFKKPTFTHKAKLFGGASVMGLISRPKSYGRPTQGMNNSL